jgi:hypothetical protein
MKSPPSFHIGGGKKFVFPSSMADDTNNIYVNSQSLGFYLMSATRYIFSCDAALVIEVEGPDGTFMPPPPGDTPYSVGAGEIAVLKGRWNGFKFITTGNVTLQTDHTLGAWQ